MASSGSVTDWISQLKAGEEDALRRLHARYWPTLVALARNKLPPLAGRVADNEDVAQEALWSFYLSLKAGRLPRLTNRHDFLALLTHIIACRAANQIESERTIKRGGGRVRAESIPDGLPVTRSLGRGVEQAPDERPTPLEQALLNDCYRQYVGGLPEGLRPFAEFYLAGYTRQEIARRAGCAQRTVDRKIALILEKWQQLAQVGINQQRVQTP